MRKSTSQSRGFANQPQRTSSASRRKPAGENSARALVPVSTNQNFPDGFDKREWMQALKIIKRDFVIEDRDRFRPLLKLKKEPAIKDFMEEVERIEKKQEIGLMRERTQINDFMEKSKQDVDCARSMFKQCKTDSSYLDRIQGKCQMIQQNLKNFKLKSRATYQNLVEEEQELMAELSAAGDKFDAWAAEPPTESPSNKPPIGGRPPLMGKGSKGAGRQLGPLVGSARASSYSKRMGIQNQRQASAPRFEGEGDYDEEESAEVIKMMEIKSNMDQVEIDIIQNGGPNCGWEASDHKDFLRLHTQMASKVGTIAFINAMARAVPLADEAQVRIHVAAYVMY